jgi:acyl carrier protein
MKKDAILNKVISVVSEKFKKEPSDISEETCFSFDLGADSLDMYDVAIDMEAEFGIKIVFDDFKNVENVSDVVSYIENKLNSKDN